MMGWAIAFLVIFLLAILPLGVSARYEESGPLVQVVAGPIRVTLFPKKKGKKKKEKAKKEKKKKEPAQKKEEPKKEKKGGSWKDFIPLVKTGLAFLGDFRRKLRVNRLEVKVILAGGDPGKLALSYGRANMALGVLWPQLERCFAIKKRDVSIQCDFEAEKTTIYANMKITITLGRLLALVCRYGLRALKQFMAIKNKNKAVQNNESSTSQYVGDNH